MVFLKSLIISFSMFSAIPMPRVGWNERNMRYMLCAFPLVGAVIGIAAASWAAFVVFAQTVLLKNIGKEIAALGFVLIPVIITGKIHIDGFMDTCDAVGSRAERERKLEIMKDPHCGSFAVVSCALYFLAQYALSCSIFGDVIDSGRKFENQWQMLQHFFPLAPMFVSSRLLSAFAVSTFPIAKNSGLLRTFADASAKRFTAAWCGIWFALHSLLSSIALGLPATAATAAQIAVFVLYYFGSRHHFGGITGDTAGAFVQISELASLLAVAGAYIFF